MVHKYSETRQQTGQLGITEKTNIMFAQILICR